MTFYSKLTQELKRQFKTSDILIPDTRAKCVAVAQRIWEGLHGVDDKRGLKDRATKPGLGPSTSTSLKYPRLDSSRDQKDWYHLDHCSRDDQNKEKSRNKSKKDQIIYFSYNKPGHYALSCPDRKGSSDKTTTRAKVQSARQDYSPIASTQASSRAESPQLKSESEDSSDSLN
jgi:hypothetical protein